MNNQNNQVITYQEQLTTEPNQYTQQTQQSFHIDNPQSSRSQNNDFKIVINKQKNGLRGMSLFSDDDIRKGFVRKVLLIFGCQMLATSFLVLLAVLQKSYRDFTADPENSTVWVIALVLLVITLVALSCFRDCCRAVPLNYILLVVFTLSMGYLISCICAVTTPESVLFATLMLSFLGTSLAVYATITENDVTVYTAFFMYSPLAVIALIIVGSMYQDELVSTIVSLCIIGIYSVYLVYDIQKLTQPHGGNGCSYQIDDYIIAALDIYLDLAMLFIQLLKVMR